MRKTGFILSLVCAALFLAPAAAQAQATRTWVSGVGDDVNPCSRTAPCKTFAGAISKTATGGEIDVLDPGGFGTVTITKSITIASEGPGEGGISASGTTGVNVNCVSDTNCNVVLRGLQIDGGPLATPGQTGVKFILGKSLIISNCQIRNFTSTTNGYGVWVATSTGTQSLLIENSTISNNGVGASNTGGGVFVAPTGSATVNVALNNVALSNNNFGFRADSSGTSGGIFASVSNSQAVANTNGGVAAIGNTTPSQVTIDHTTITGNGVGINANGGSANTILRIGNSKLAYNATGYKQQNSAVMTSFGTNEINDNPNIPR